MSEPSPISQAAQEHCAALVRVHDRDRYLAALFAPERHRAALFAIRAFAVEVARIADLVSDPLPGEVRLQWWRDVLQPSGSRGAAGPVAEALVASIERYRLPIHAFLDVLDARTFDLYHDPMATMRDLEGYCGETRSSLIRLETLVLADGGSAGSPDAAGHAGVAEGLLATITAVPRHRAQGRSYVPVEILTRHNDDEGKALADLEDAARRQLASATMAARAAPAAVQAAFLPLSLVGPGLDRWKKGRELPDWRRQWILWRTARRGGSVT